MKYDRCDRCGEELPFAFPRATHESASEEFGTITLITHLAIERRRPGMPAEVTEDAEVCASCREKLATEAAVAARANDPDPAPEPDSGE